MATYTANVAATTITINADAGPVVNAFQTTKVKVATTQTAIYYAQGNTSAPVSITANTATIIPQGTTKDVVVGLGNYLYVQSVPTNGLTAGWVSATEVGYVANSAIPV